MASIRERTKQDGTKVFHVQVRMTGYPARTASFSTERAAKRWAKVIEALGGKVEKSLDQVRQQAPDARIVFVGYPRVLPETGPCAKVDLPPVAFARLRTTMRLVNETLKSVAAKANVEYIDMYTASAGHDACSADPWVNGSKPTKAASAYHPFEAYHQAVAAKIVALLKTKKPQA